MQGPEQEEMGELLTQPAILKNEEEKNSDKCKGTKGSHQRFF